MFRWISENYRTFLWAFGLAVAVWISAVLSADPNDTRALRSAVPIQVVGQDPSLVINNNIPKETRLTLRAPTSVLNSIESDPQSVRAVLNLANAGSGEHVLPLEIQIDAHPVKIVSVEPDTVTLSMEALETKNIRVEAVQSGEIAIGYRTGFANIKPREIVVSGAQSQVEKISQVRVMVNVNGLREDFSKTLPVEILDKDGARVGGISASPESVQVTLPITQQGGYRDVAVKVVTTGRVASGYRMTDISVSPPIVTVFASDPQLVKDMPGVIETQPLDLQNAQEDISSRAGLVLPEGVSIIGEQAVLIQVGVSAIEGSVTLVGETVEIVGLDPGLSAQVAPETVDVIVSGPLPILDTLARQDVRVTVDLTGLEPGTHQIVPTVEALIENVEVKSVLPNTIEVVIVKGIFTPTVTPTP